MKALLTALALAAVAASANAQTASPSAAPVPAPAQNAPAYGAPISLDAAQALIARAVAYGRERGWRLAIAVVEPSGELVAFVRMDDTQYGSIHVAQRKAETAARYRTTTAQMEERVLAGRVVTLANSEALAIAGGVPIIIDGRIVGAIGISGVTAAQDDETARAVLAGS